MNHFQAMALAAVDTDLTGISESVDGMSKTISEYGPSIVIMAIFFIIFILLVFLVLRSNSKMMAQILDKQNHNDKIEEELLSKLIDNALQKKEKSENKAAENIITKFEESLKPIKKKVDSMAKEIEVDKEIHSDLVGSYMNVNMAFKDASRIVLSSIKCDRVAIYVFHNGNKSMHGLPFFKMSCIHEWTNRGSNTLRGKSHTDMPLHLFVDFIEDLWKNGVYKSENVEKTEVIDNSIEEFVAYSKTKALYLDAVKDENDNISGFVVAEFENEDTFEHDEIRDKEVRNALDTMVSKISPILNYYTISKKK